MPNTRTLTRTLKDFVSTASESAKPFILPRPHASRPLFILEPKLAFVLCVFLFTKFWPIKLQAKEFYFSRKYPKRSWCA